MLANRISFDKRTLRFPPPPSRAAAFFYPPLFRSLSWDDSIPIRFVLTAVDVDSISMWDEGNAGAPSVFRRHCRAGYGTAAGAAVEKEKPTLSACGNIRHFFFRFHFLWERPCLSFPLFCYCHFRYVILFLKEVLMEVYDEQQGYTVFFAIGRRNV